MTTKYSDVTAKCPFFKSSGMNCVTCEGLYNKSTLSQNFVNRNDLSNFRILFCDNNYQKCKIYRLLEKKYE